MQAITVDSAAASPALRDDLPLPRPADNEVHVRVRCFVRQPRRQLDRGRHGASSTTTPWSSGETTPTSRLVVSAGDSLLATRS